MKNDRLKTKVKNVSRVLLRDDDFKQKKQQAKIPTVKEIKEKMKEMEESFDDRK